MANAKKILLEQIKKKKMIKFLELADIAKSRRECDAKCAQLLTFKKIFGSYVDPELRGKEGLKHIFMKIKRRLGYMRAIYNLNEVARRLSGGAMRKHENTLSKTFDLDKLKRNVQLDQTQYLSDVIKVNQTNIDKNDDQGYTLLTYACYQGKAEIVRILLEYGANPNCTLIMKKNESKELVNPDDNIENDGNTPLHFAVEQDFRKIIDLLIDNGADETIENFSGKTPWDLYRKAI